MYAAFKKLGYRSYHASEVPRSLVPKSAVYWKEAIEAKYFGSGRKYRKEEFEKLLGDYSVRVFSPLVYLLLSASLENI